MLLTLSGNPGSGKSSVAQAIAQKLGLERLNIGDVMREQAKVRQMNLNEYMEYAITHPEVDKEADEITASRARALIAQGKSVIAEGRLTFHFLPEATKVFLKVDALEAARRVWLEMKEKHNRDEGVMDSQEQVAQLLKERDERDVKRFKELYGISHLDESQYDFVLDTTHLTKEQVIKEVLEFLKKIKE